MIQQVRELMERTNSISPMKKRMRGESKKEQEERRNIKNAILEETLPSNVSNTTAFLRGNVFLSHIFT